MTLLRQQFKAEWLTLLIWASVTGAMVFYSVFLWESLHASGALAELEAALHSMLPPALAAMFGDSLTALPGWLQTVAYGGWTSLSLTVYTALFTTAIVTREMDRRTMEFLLSLPVSRWQVLLWRWAGLALALVALHAVHVAAIAGAVAAIGQTPAVADYALTAVSSVLLFLALGSIFLAITIFLDDYGPGVGVTTGVGLLLWFFHNSADKAEGFLKTLRGALPFGLYNPAATLIRHEIPWGDWFGLALISAGALVLAIWLFQRKQIAV